MTTPDRQIRWMACKNVSDFTIPPFAFVEIGPYWAGLGGDDPHAYFMQVENDQQAIWQAKRTQFGPVSATENWNNTHWDNSMRAWHGWWGDFGGWGGVANRMSMIFACNGPTAIEPDGYGQCTQDWPARVRHDSSAYKIEVAATCGPGANSFDLFGNSAGFASLGYDPTSPLYDENEDWSWDRVNTMWITPWDPRIQSDGSVKGVAATYPTGTQVTLEAAQVYPLYPSVAPDVDTYVNKMILTKNDLDVAVGMQVRNSGLYMVGFQALLSSSPDSEPAPPATPNPTPHGSALRVELMVNDRSSGFYGVRVHVTESGYGGYDVILKENVAFTGILNLGSGDVLSIYNTSAADIDISAMQFWACWINPINGTRNVYVPLT